MAENPSGQKSDVRCPICGSTAESGYIYGGRSDLRWRTGEPSFLRNVVTGTLGGIPIGEIDFCGTHVRGIRCAICRRIVLEFAGGEDGPGIELVIQASDLEQDGEWDRALALYRRVLGEPSYQLHHEYARNGIKVIEEKKSRMKGPAG